MHEIKPTLLVCAAVSGLLVTKEFKKKHLQSQASDAGVVLDAINCL